MPANLTHAYLEAEQKFKGASTNPEKVGALEEIAKAGEVMVYRHEGSWECMDHGRDVAHLKKLWKNNQAFWKVWD